MVDYILSEVKLAPIDVKVLNLSAVRLNCLVLASKEEQASRKVDLAKEYYEFVMNGKTPNDFVEKS